MPEATQAVQSQQGFDNHDLSYWKERFKAVLAHLGAMHDAFKQMNYIIEAVFPTVQGFSSWQMGNEAVAMHSVSNDLNDLNAIKAVFNSCQDPDYASKDMNGTKLTEQINALAKRVEGNKAFETKDGGNSIINQLKVITHASENPGLWNGNQINTGQHVWWNGTTRQVGTYSSYIKWMWSREWQGLNPVIPFNWNTIQDMYWYTGPSQPSSNPKFDIKHDSWRISYFSKADGKTIYVSYDYYKSQLQNWINNDEAPSQVSGLQSPIFEGNNVKFWDGKEWLTETKSQYCQWVLGRLEAVQKAHPKGWNDWLTLEPQPYEVGGGDNPKFTTGPTTQAFSAISTMFNSQSSEQQSKFKYLQSNMQQYLGIDHDTMSQIVKEEQNITAFTKQQSN